MNLKWFTYGRKYAGKGYSKQHRGITSKTVETTHKNRRAKERNRFGSSLDRFTGEPNRLKRVKGFVGFSKSFSTLLSLSNRIPSSFSLKKTEKNRDEDLHLLPCSGAVAGHPRVAALPPEFPKTLRFNFFCSFQYPFSC